MASAPVDNQEVCHERDLFDICVHRRITKLRKRSSILAIGLWEHTLAWFDLISPKGRTSRRRRRIPWRIPKRCFQHDLTKNERRLSLFFESGEISRRRSDFLLCSFDNSFLLYPISLYFDVTQKFSDCLWNRGFLTNTVIYYSVPDFHTYTYFYKYKQRNIPNIAEIFRIWNIPKFVSLVRNYREYSTLNIFAHCKHSVHFCTFMVRIKLSGIRICRWRERNRRKAKC